MIVEDDINLRIITQDALLTNVTPQMRAVSLEIDSVRAFIWVRFIFDGKPSESIRDSASCVGTEIIASYPAPWDIDEEFIECPAPERMDHRRLLVYLRCEDDWVSASL